MTLPRKLPTSTLGTIGALVLACASLVSGSDATANTAESVAGTQRIYGNIPPDQAEHLSSADRIKSTAVGGTPTAIWETLEHGERVECLDCIPVVSELLYVPNARTREIAAWWLRRRMFGVFGKGEVYEQTIKRLASDPDPVTRVYAANALGEFLALPGVAACAKAVAEDGEPTVRAAAVIALGRLNDDGNGALSRALGDGDPRVRAAGLIAAHRINAFKDADAVVRLVGDPDANVRRGAAELLSVYRTPSSVDGLIAALKDPDANVRNAAAHSLGALHDPKARPALEDAAKTDANPLVRDQASIALRRL